MPLINKKLIEQGMKLEAARREKPLDNKGFSVKFDEANAEYTQWIIMHGYILLEELNKHMKE